MVMAVFADSWLELDANAREDPDEVMSRFETWLEEACSREASYWDPPLGASEVSQPFRVTMTHLSRFVRKWSKGAAWFARRRVATGRLVRKFYGLKLREHPALSAGEMMERLCEPSLGEVRCGKKKRVPRGSRVPPETMDDGEGSGPE
jgi:hypothetical protein